MPSKDLIDKLEKAGYVMFETVNDNLNLSLLKGVIDSKDPRMWHMFPVILANAYRSDPAIFNKLLNNIVRNGHNNAGHLLILSNKVYQKELNDNNLRNTVNNYVKNNKLPDVPNNKYDPEKASELFRLYYRRDSDKVKEILPIIIDNSLEYALSTIFSAKQKELVLKKFKGEKLNKTEKEYYSRVVKKKLVALANEEMYKLAVTIVNRG